MVPIDEAALRHSLEASERRRAEAVARRSRDRKRFLIGIVAVLVVVPLGLVAGLATAKAPAPPLVILTWPKPEVTQVLGSDQTVVNRAGQPLDLSITHPEAWDVEWHTSQTENVGESMHWLPSSPNETVHVVCKPKVSGLAKISAIFWSKPELTVHSVEAKREGDYTRSIDAGTSGVWISPYIFGQGKIGWNEKTLPIFVSALDLVPDTKLDSSLAATREQATPAFWQIVNDFEGETEKPSADGATFAALTRPDVEDLMPRIARAVLKAAPDVSVKFVIRLDKKPQVAVIRLAFDGKKEHRAWIRRAGEKSGGPLTGWETWTPPVVPALPPLPPTQPH